MQLNALSVLYSYSRFKIRSFIYICVCL